MNIFRFFKFENICRQLSRKPRYTISSRGVVRVDANDLFARSKEDKGDNKIAALRAGFCSSTDPSMDKMLYGEKTKGHFIRADF